MVDEDFPLPMDDFAYATAQLLGLEGMRQEVKLLVAQESLSPECVNHDNWNGGQWTWRVDLSLPISAYRSISPDDQQTMATRITTAMRQVIEAFDAHSIREVRIVMAVPKAPSTWKSDARAWAEGQGATNQGRVRSSNIAPYEVDGLLFRSRPEINLYRALKSRGVTFAPLPVFVRGGTDYRRIEPDFVIVHRRMLVVIEVDGEAFHGESPVDAHERLTLLSHEGVHTERVRATECETDAAADSCATRLLEVIEKLASNR